MSGQVEDRIRCEPLTLDLKWTSWYGLAVLTGFRPRSLKTLKTNVNEYSLVQDTVTGRQFVRGPDNGLVQYWDDDPEQAAMFKRERLI
jgi:hypothetical protein